MSNNQAGKKVAPVEEDLEDSHPASSWTLEEANRREAEEERVKAVEEKHAAEAKAKAKKEAEEAAAKKKDEGKDGDGKGEPGTAASAGKHAYPWLNK